MPTVTIKFVPEITILDPKTKKPVMQDEEVTDLAAQAEELKLKARTALDEGEFEKAASYLGALAGKKVIQKPWVVTQAEFYRHVLNVNERLFKGFSAITAAGAIQDGLEYLEAGEDMPLADTDAKFLAEALDKPKHVLHGINARGERVEEEREGFTYPPFVMVQLRPFLYAGKRETAPERPVRTAKKAVEVVAKAAESMAKAVKDMTEANEVLATPEPVKETPQA